MTTEQEPLTGPSLPPPACSAENSQRQNASKDSTNNPHHRCEFTFSDGRRCRNQTAPLCLHHASKQQSHSPELPELQVLCSDLSTATSINRALAQTYLLMAQGRISRKDAIAFGYLTQLLLQTVPGVRAEFVAVHGYQPWEENLAIQLRSPDSAAKGYQQVPFSDSGGLHGTPDSGDALSPLNKGEEKPTASLEHLPAGDPGPAPTQNLHNTAPESDLESLCRRTFDLFAGKYDSTPEGRHEARALGLELELLNPPRSKPPKGRLGDVVSVVRRIQEFQEKESAPATQPCALNYFGQPIQPVSYITPKRRAPADANASTALSPASAVPSESSSTPTAPPKPPLAPSESSSASDRRFPSDAVEQLEKIAPAPVPPGGHKVDWHAPAAWSGQRQPGPFPKHASRLQRQLRNLGSCGLRRW